MDSDQYQKPRAIVEQQQQARSSPCIEPRSDSMNTMGVPCRTPSPLREPFYASEVETTPKAEANSCFSIAMETPPGSPSGQIAYSTPKSVQPHSSAFGLLTPSTPNFGDFVTRSFAISEDDEAEDTRECMISQAPEDDAGEATINEGNTKKSDRPEQQGNAVVSVQSQEYEQMDCDVEDSEDTDDVEPMQPQFDMLQQQIRDAELAATLIDQTDSPGNRRSTRLARKETVKAPSRAPTAVVPTKPVGTAQHTLPDLVVAPPKSSFTDEAVVQLPPDANPAYLTLDWQLQYPSGGSTHPSYPYPQMDPRLFFDPGMVPGVNGLPCISAISALILPMGWRHVTWSGFLPIAFDPYHQAFKLTPIGPLPLTCEEVQQGGLAKYVPGGEAHPEAGLLPDLAAYCDGSDEVYNFDDVDWVLPWPKGESFDGFPYAGANVASSDLYSTTTDAKSPSSAGFGSKSHYIEARDCPDSIVDIDDAWRWLAEKCQDTFSKFEATPGKSWKGTGIHKTSKRLKQPIASLLVSALAETLASPGDTIARFLLNQNGREFCPFRSVATPVHVNIALLGDTEFTLKELLCFFPSHYSWRKGGDRLVRAGLSAGDMANMINMTRQLSGDAARKIGTVAHVITYETDKSNDRTRIRIVRDEEELVGVQNYTAQGWTYDAWELVDYPVLGLAHGLVTLPEGPDAGPLTALIKYCQAQGRHDVMLSDVYAKLEEAGISSLIEPGEHGCPDKEVSARHHELLKEDRKRVLKVEREKKRAAEMEQGVKRKRVKTE